MTEIVFSLYLIIVLLTGIISYRRTRNISDFSIGGRKLPFFVIALSEKASDFSAWLLLGLPGLAYADPLSAIWAGVGCMIGTIFNWVFIANRLREESLKTNSITFPEFLSRKVGDDRGVIKNLSVFVITVFFLFYISAQIMGIGKVLNFVFGIPREIGMFSGFLIVVLYTAAGGFIAVSWTDFFQALFMVFGLFFLFSSMVPEVSDKALTIKSTGTAMMIANLSISLGYPGQPHILMRYFALNSKRDVRRSAFISIIWTFFALTFAIGIGLFARHIIDFEVGDRELISLIMAERLLPAVLYGVMASAVVSASMSTVDSQLLVLTTSISHDVLGRRLRAERELLISRAFTVGVSLLAFVFALSAREFVYWLVLYAWGGLAASFGPPLILLLYWKRTTKAGVIAGMVGGMLTTILWHNIPFLRNVIYELVPAFFLSFISVLAVSLITKSERE